MRIATMMLAAAALSLGVTAASADDPMANTYANTVVTKDSKGMSANLMFSQDGTYTLKATDPNGQPVLIAGNKWALKDDGKTICLTPAAPPHGPPAQTTCSPLQAHNVGDAWSVTNDQGQTFNVSLTAGR
jgi:hypothetical protein